MSKESYDKSFSTIYLTAKINGVNHDLGSVDLRKNPKKVLKQITEKIIEIQNIEEEERKTHIRTQIYRLHKEYTVPPSRRAYTLGIFGQTIWIIKTHLQFSHLSRTLEEKAEWSELSRWGKKFDPKPSIEKKCKELAAGLPWTRDYEGRKKAIIDKANEDAAIIKEAIPYIKEVLVIYNRRIRQLQKEQLESKPKETPPSPKKERSLFRPFLKFRPERHE